VLSNVACVGAWRSLVAHLNGVQGVGGSNPLAPTKNYYNKKNGLAKWLIRFLVDRTVVTVRHDRISVNLAGLHIMGDPAIFVSLVESRNYIRIKLSTIAFINNLNDYAILHFFSVGAVGGHGIVDIGHR
jgi:hypothetical protein